MSPPAEARPRRAGRGRAPVRERTLPRGVLCAAAPGNTELRRHATAGFDAVVVRIDAGSFADAHGYLQSLLSAAAKTRLAVWIDIDLQALPFAVTESGVRAAPRRAATGPLPDPRLPPSADGDTGLTVAAFGETLAALEQAGVAGVVCRSPQRFDRTRWTALTAACALRWIAWTPGLPAGEIDALRDCGLAGVVSSLPWWDGAARWWDEEFARLRSVAPVLMPVLAAQAATPAVRQLALASALGDGLLVDAALVDAIANDADGAPPIPSSPTDSAVGWERAVPTRTGATALLGTRRTPEGQVSHTLVLVNPDAEHARVVATQPLRLALGELRASADVDLACPLDAGAVRVVELIRPEPATERRVAVRDGLAAPRVSIEAVSPAVDAGRFAARRVVGDTLRVEATIFSDGHEQLAAHVCWRAPGSRKAERTPMRALGNDRWCADIPLDRIGRLTFVVEAWRDPFATAFSDLGKKRAAGNVQALDLDEAVAIVAAAQPAAGSADQRAHRTLVERLGAGDDDTRLGLLLEPATASLLSRIGPRAFVARSNDYAVEVERKAAAFSAWYELFPRSLGGADAQHGTFDDVIAQLPRIRAMGFDVLYMPPIHPIGLRNRKGRNNALTAQPGEPGSPYAIGSEAGGHDALHPELGDFDAFARLIAAAAAHGMEVALDFAIQCSPDHPWLQQHPEWFAHRADGSIRYAENPPKRYEDIVNVDFHAGVDDEGLWTALRDVVLFWVARGVRLFRVDNPHTKPFAFWEWMIADVRGRAPDVVFLSEAFTRPAPMYRLAKLGFSQSYTYFTWRNTKRELIDYFEELDRSPVSEFFRPHLFVNTPDINPRFLQHFGRAGHRIRAVLAATLSGLWGVYAPFELCEATPLPGKEEYLDSEKYQRRDWDWQRPGAIGDDLARLNAIRRANPALHTHRHVTFYNAFDDDILYFGKRVPGSDEIVLVAVNLDPHTARAAAFEVPLWEFGLPDDAGVEVDDLWHGTRATWHGKTRHLHLDPARQGFALWRIRPLPDTHA